MSKGYQYDIFISYSRRKTQAGYDNPVFLWVKEYFHPLLSQWLTMEMGQVNIFIDWETETGTINWPQYLQESINRTRLLLPIWSAQYFRSPWCVAEWQSMLLRQQHLNRPGHARGLIYPIVFFDGDLFPPEADMTQASLEVRDNNWNSNAPAFKSTSNYFDFETWIKTKVVPDLKFYINDVPPWQADWPVVDFKAIYQTLNAQRPRQPRPRF